MSQSALLPAIDASEEVTFGLEELFYSRTDERGIILAGNSVFKRISGYEWKALLGAPHRIIRNRATPRAVFRILWSTIQANEPAVAYVCNKAADGRPYWVLATVLPFKHGYLSIRIKPSTPLFQAVKGIYARLTEAEASGALSVEASVAEIDTTLRQLGFSSYVTFMRTALSQEFAARAATLGVAGLLHETTITRIREGLAEAIAGQDVLQHDFEGLKILPTNLSILASRLEPTGGPLAAVANIYLTNTLEILAKIKQFTSGESSLINRMSERFERAIFLVTCATLQREVACNVEREDWALSGIDPEVEIGCLTLLGLNYGEAALDAINQACDLADTIATAGAKLRRSMLSLETVTVMGKVESSRIGAEGDRVRSTIVLLHELNAQISMALEKIGSLSTTINTGMREIRAGFLMQSCPEASTGQ